MNQFTVFLQNHWVLWVTLIIVVALIIYEETKRNIGGVLKIGAQQLVNFMNHHDAVVVDLRSKEEFAHGHLLSALNIERADLEKNIHQLKKNRPVILIGSIAKAALTAGMLLKKQGFEKIYVLDGGMVAWQKASLPLVKD